jgi:hypothetical protein
MCTGSRMVGGAPTAHVKIGRFERVSQTRWAAEDRNPSFTCEVSTEVAAVLGGRVSAGRGAIFAGSLVKIEPMPARTAVAASGAVPRGRTILLEPRLLQGVALRAAWLTVMLRPVLLVLFVMQGGAERTAGAAVVPALVLGVMLAPLVLVLCALDGRATNEQLFHASLGIGARFTLAVSAAVVLVADAGSALLVVALGPGRGSIAALVAVGGLALYARSSARRRVKTAG